MTNQQTDMGVDREVTLPRTTYQIIILMSGHFGSTREIEGREGSEGSYNSNKIIIRKWTTPSSPGQLHY